MTSSTSTSSHARSRSLRSNTLKPPTVTTTSAQSASGPTNATLFVRNLRLLDLDLRGDWPDITELTFSTKDAQQNQRKRIQSVEWALYQLFDLWDPEETRNKLKPFFPPLEPLQSLNLRAALFRSLEQAKKTGALGRDAVLRKTMLDECKGEKLEEVLAVFSNAVLRKSLREDFTPQSIAQQLASENLSYLKDRQLALSTLLVVHRASLQNHLRHKKSSRAVYTDFSNLLDLNERRIVRRREFLKELTEKSEVLDINNGNGVEALIHMVEKNWAGSEGWLEVLLYGDSRAHRDGLLATPFDDVWKHVESGSIGDIEGTQHLTLLEKLEVRIQTHNDRLEQWQQYTRGWPKPKATSISKQKEQETAPSKKIDLDFTHHHSLQIDSRTYQDLEKTTRSIPLDEYSRVVESMFGNLADVGKPKIDSSRAARESLGPQYLSSTKDTPPTVDEEWSSASDTGEASAARLSSHLIKSTPQTPPSEISMLEFSREKSFEILPPKTHQLPSPTKKTNISISTRNVGKGEARVDLNDGFGRMQEERAQPQPRAKTPVIDPLPQSAESESDLAEEILNSVSASSPSPKKARHTLSLAERTRLSMSRASHSKYSDMHDDVDNLADLTRLSIRTKSAQPARPMAEPEEGKHADLIERTRKSMAGFEAAQKKAQIERRKSMKDAKKKQRESSYFPMVEEEVPVTPSINRVELIDGNPDYESVFKSRPKIKTSPAVSPTRIIMEDESED